jgi:outer membrane receptor for ferrienterochelin and colicins
MDQRPSLNLVSMISFCSLDILTLTLQIILTAAESELTLTPHHSLKGDLLYSLPGKWRIGLDYEFKSSQALSNGTHSREFWTFGAVVEYTKNNYTLFGNLKTTPISGRLNMEALVSGPNETPQFTEVWAPLDGIVFNTGIKVRL